MTRKTLTSDTPREKWVSDVRRGNPDPETRVGICCACGQDGVALFKVPDIFRYRCADCFERETGYRHHLAPPAGRIVLP